MRKRYDDKTKAVVLAYLASVGGNYQKTAREYSLPATTIQHWVKQQNEGKLSTALAHLISTERSKLGNRMVNKAERLISAMTDQKLAEAPLKDLALALDIMTKGASRLAMEDAKQGLPEVSPEEQRAQNLSDVKTAIFELAQEAQKKKTQALEQGKAEAIIIDVEVKEAIPVDRRTD